MMKNGKRGAIHIAIALIGAGVLVFAAAFALGGFSLKGMGGSYTQTPYRPDEDFDRVEIRDDMAQVHILPAEDGVCSVLCDEEREGSYTVEIEDGVLRVRRERKWYEMISVHFAQPEVTVLLPEARYRSIDVHTASGGIEVENLEADELKLRSTSGKVSLEGVNAEALEAKSSSGNLKTEDCRLTKEATLHTTSGRVCIENVEADGLRVESTSGGIEIDGLNAANLEAESTSGRIRMSDSTVAGRAELHTTSGGVQLERADAGEFEIHTTSGGVKGSVRSDKLFDVKTTSGSVDIPPSIRDAGAFIASTTSGSVRITVE